MAAVGIAMLLAACTSDKTGSNRQHEQEFVRSIRAQDSWFERYRNKSLVQFGHYVCTMLETTKASNAQRALIDQGMDWSNSATAITVSADFFCPSNYSEDDPKETLLPIQT